MVPAAMNQHNWKKNGNVHFAQRTWKSEFSPYGWLEPSLKTGTSISLPFPCACQWQSIKPMLPMQWQFVPMALSGLFSTTNKSDVFVKLKGRMSVHLCYKTHWFLPMILMVKKNAQCKSPSQALSVILRQDCQPMKTSFQWIQFVLPSKCCGYISLVMSDEEKAIFLKQRTWCIPVQNKRQSMTVCAYCSIVVEYCSKKAIWCKMQRG